MNTNTAKAERRPRGSGSIYQRSGSQRWEAKLDLGWVNGKHRSKTFTAATEREARSKLRAALKAIEMGQAPVPQTITVEKYLTQWLAGKLKLRAGTANRYEQVIRRQLIPHLGHTPLAKLTKADVSRMLVALPAEGIGARTAVQVRAVLRAALSDAISDGLLLRNVARDAEAPRTDEPVPYNPSEEVVGLILAACTDPSLKRAVVVALHSGLRWGEQYGLRWQDVDLAGGYLIVSTNLTRTRGGYTLSDPKTKRSRRRVDLSAPALAALKAEQEAQEANGAPVPLIPDLVFTNGQGAVRPNDPRSFQAALSKAGILIRPDTGVKLTWHDLRAAHACLALHFGANLAQVSKRLGHSSTAITSRYYGGVEDSDQVALGRRFGGLLTD